MATLFSSTLGSFGQLELEELDYELRVQGLAEASSFHKSGSGLELHHAAAIGQLWYVRFLVEKMHYNPMQGD